MSTAYVLWQIASYETICIDKFILVALAYLNSMFSALLYSIKRQ